MRSAWLRGRESQRVGVADTVAEGRAAIALSRGGAAKTYAYTDPNEDAAGFAEGARGVLIAVADGHSGCEAAEAVIETLLRLHAEAWTEGDERSPAAWSAEVEKAVCAANDAALGCCRPAERRAPRTTLSLALLRPDQNLLLVTSVGDSHVFRVGSDSVTDLAGGDAPVRYLGSRAKDGTPLPPDGPISMLPLSGTRAVVAATDGLSEFGIGVDDPEAAVAAAVASGAAAPPELRAREAARHVVESALRAQRENRAGDNVAAAVAWLD